MFKKHKKFDLHKKRDEQNCERLNHPKKFKYFKYFIIPAIVAFSLLCILMNVNFSGKDPYANIKTKHKKNSTSSPATLNEGKITDQKNHLPFSKTSNVIYKNGSSKHLPQDIFKINPVNIQILQYKQTTFNASLVGAISCQEFRTNCTLICKNGNVNFMEENLNDLQEYCRGVDINLILDNCEFTNGVLQQSFFHGFFSLAYLSITKCNLQTIKAQAFKTKNVKNLKTLIFRHNQVNTLDSTTFEGLSLLENFEFLQAPLSNSFKGDLFLKPLENRLQIAIIQPCLNDSVNIFDPLKWWQDLQMISLTKLDLSNTNLVNSLNEKTFLNFKVLESVILFNCNLLTIKGSVFDSIWNTLKYLDLRSNHLKTLDLEFLEKVENVDLALSLNDWNCDCDTEMLKYLENRNNKISEDMICLTPKKWQEITLTQVIGECKESEITTVKATTSETTITIDNNTTPTEDTSTISVEPTTEISTLKTTTTPTSKEPITTPSTTNGDISTVSVEPTTPNSTLKTTTVANSSEPTTTPSYNESSTDYTTAITTSSVAPESSTKNPIYTTTTPKTSQPPFIPPNLVNIDCKINPNNEKISINVLQPKANFSIITTSSTSVTINVQAPSYLEKFSLIYFNNQTDYQDVFETPNFKIKSVLVKIFVKNLTDYTAYIFCFIQDSSIRISPFDCKAHFMAEFYGNKLKWLSTSHQIWFFVITSIISLVLFFLSLLLVYCLLRHNPHWIIYRNKRIFPVLNNPKKVLILSRKFSNGSIRSSNYLKALPLNQNNPPEDMENSLYASQLTVPKARAPIKPINIIYSESCVPTKTSEECNPETSRSSKYLQALPPLPHNTNEKPGNSLYSSGITVPYGKAPIKPISLPRVPNNRKCHKPSCSPVSRFRKSQKVYPKTMDYLDIIDNEPEYQSIDYYETINF